MAIAAALAVLLAPLAASAQQAGKVYRIGYLSYTGCPIRPEIMGPFFQGLRELGYVEGQNIIIECRSAPGAPDRLPGFAAELVRLKVDVIVAAGTPHALAAKQATKTIPIVMVYVGDPVGSGLVTSLARPGGNVTGLSVLTPDIVPKALEILKEAAPSVSRVAVWIDPTNPGQTLADKQMDAAAKILGVRPERVDVRTAANLDAAFAAALRQREEALFVYPLPIAPLEGVAPIGLRLADNHGANLRGIADEQCVPEALHEGVKPDGVASALDTDRHRPRQRGVELLDRSPIVSQLVLGHRSRAGIQHGHLLLARVQVASHECHGVGLLSESAVAHGEHSNSARGPFS